METSTEPREFVKPSKARIVRYVSNTHMALAHKGLKTLAKKLHIDIDAMEFGEFIVFMNGRQSAFKLMTANEVLVYYKHPKNHRIDPRVISLIPYAFNGGKFDMDDVLKKTMQKDFNSKRN